MEYHYTNPKKLKKKYFITNILYFFVVVFVEYIQNKTAFKIFKTKTDR